MCRVDELKNPKIQSRTSTLYQTLEALQQEAIQRYGSACIFSGATPTKSQWVFPPALVRDVSAIATWIDYHDSDSL